jgi:asparagine synthetase B (glutamine-hydrolysing)
VRAHLVTDAPVGIVLTGGTASAFVAALALEQTPGLRTFALAVDAQPDLAAIAEAFDEPFAAPAAAQAYLLAERAARQTKVVLCAAGGDDLFRPERPGEIVPPPLREELTGRPAAFEAAGNGAPTVTDGPWMAHSIEARVPYLDTVVTNLVGALPPRDRKRLLRKAAAPLLKRSRQPRATAPLGTWLREWLDVLSAETLNRQGFFRPDVVRRLIDEQVAGQIDRTRELWSLLTFTLWYERHVESAAPAEARAEVLVEGRP